MRTMRQPPNISTVPTLGDGSPPPPDVQEQVVRNQVKTAAQWDSTAMDMAVSNILVEKEKRRETRWEIVALAAVAVLLLIIGCIWTFNNYTHDRMVAEQRSAAQQTPYTPETIR